MKKNEKKHQAPPAPKRKATDTSAVGGIMATDAHRTDGLARDRLTKRQLDAILARPEDYLKARAAIEGDARERAKLGL